MTTDLEHAIADYWCAAHSVRTKRPMTCVERILANASLLDLTASAPTPGLQRRAREACLGAGIGTGAARIDMGGAA